MGFWGREAIPRPRRIRENLRLSPNEERYLLAEAMTSQVYNAPAAVRLIGPFDVDALEAAIVATCNRHEAHRTGYELGADGRFTKYVEDRARVVLKRMSMPGATDDELREVVRSYFFTHTNHSPENLHRFLVIKCGENDHVYAFGLHHVTADGMAFRNFALEVHARRTGRPVSDEPAPQYSDYWDFDWENSDGYRAAEAYWTERMGSLGAVGAWPADRAVEGFQRSRPSVSLMMSPETVARTKDAATRIGVTHFTYFYAIYAVLLARMTGSSSICTTFQSAGRRSIGASEEAQGVFSNALLMATNVDEAETLAALAARLRVEVREAISHEIFPYHHVTRKTGLQGRYAINWFPHIPEVPYADVEVRSLDLKDNQDDDDLNLRFTTYGEEMQVHIFYKASAFSEARVRTVAETIIAMGEAFAQDPHQPIASVRTADLQPKSVLPDPAEPLPAGGDELIQAAFLEMARARPEATAILGGGQAITYGELEARSAAFAQDLKRRGVAPGDRVAILAERRPQLVCAMLAAARLGAVFLVLDSADPEARLSTLLDICAPKALVHTGGRDVQALAERLASMRRLNAIDAAAPLAETGREGLDAARPDAPAYFLFTSGSTGRPKCVAASHQPLTHFVRWQAAAFDLGAGDRFAMLSGLAHDPLLRDVFTPLSVGATLLIPDQATVLEPGALAPWLRETRASVAHITPPLGQILAAGAAKAGALPDLRRLFWGGDALRPALAAKIAALAPHVEQVNFYGATETPQAAAFCRLDGDPDWKSVPIGRGSDGFQILIVDRDRRPVGVGEVGEIAVRSNYLSLGYVEAGRVLPPGDRGLDPAGQANIYYTGDRGCYLPDGQVIFVGRTDDQVKLRGHRVDLSEVTAALLACPGIGSAIALPVGEGDDLRIAAFVVRDRGPRTPEAEFRTLLAARLPGYMVPQVLRVVDALPLLANGKIDRKALLALAAAEPEPVAPVSRKRATPVEQALIAAWASILGAEAITPEASFASLGGDSLSYVQAYLATEEVIGEAPVGWHLMSISELAGVERARHGLFSVIDMPIAIRAASILLVVAGHYYVLGGGGHLTAAQAAARGGGGATSALMTISGFMFGNLALQQVFKQQSAQPLLRTLWSMFVPTAVLSFVIFLLRLPGDPPESYIYLLTGDLQNYSALLAQGKGGDNYLWFVHCLLHMMVLLYLAALGLQAAKLFGIGLRSFLWGLFGLACLMRFVLPIAWDPGFFTGFRDGFTMVNFLPTTHLATIVLGALVATTPNLRGKLLLAPVIVAYGFVTAYFYGHGPGEFAAAGALLLLAIPRVKVPRIAAPVVFSLAGASLWIYLSHMLLRDAFQHFGLAHAPVLTMVVALAAGVGFWTLWARGIGVINRAFKRPLALQPDAAV